MHNKTDLYYERLYSDVYNKCSKYAEEYIIRRGISNDPLDFHTQKIRNVKFRKGNIEFELRKQIGSEQLFDKIEDLLNAKNDWVKIDDWYMIYDYHYYCKCHGDSSVFNYPKIRTRVNFKNGGIHIDHQRKIPIMTAEVDEQSKINVNYEADCEISEERVNIDKCTISCRKIYYLSNPENPTEKIWKYELIRSWSGKTKQNAENCFLNETPKLYLEIECIDPQKYVDNSFDNIVFLFLSLILKIGDFDFYLNKIPSQ